MAKKEYKQLDSAAIQSILQENQGKTVEIVLRLAWNLGFTRDEIHQLKWSDISLEDKVITLPDREVPMDDETVLCLVNRRQNPKIIHTEYVIVAEYRKKGPTRKESISRIVRTAMNDAGLPKITLVDLRQDYVIRMLETHDWPYVARVTGTPLSTLYANYSKYFTNNEVKKAKEPFCGDYKAKLWEIIEAEGLSAQGLALRMVAELEEIQVLEIIELTWDQVDLENGWITLSNRKMKVSSELLAMLRTVKEGRPPDADCHVLLTEKAQKPFNEQVISRKIRNALIRKGVDIPLRDLLASDKYKADDEVILEYIKKKGHTSWAGAKKELPFKRRYFYSRVLELIERGEVVRIGQELYIAGTVVPPEEHYEVVRAHLEMMGGGYRNELADLLGVSHYQASWILQNMVEEGKLKQIGRMYRLP